MKKPALAITGAGFVFQARRYCSAAARNLS